MTSMFPLTGPLANIKVLELGIAMAGPYCGMMLADYGADVIKIEHPVDGDLSRAWSPDFPGGVSHYFAAVNRNKRSLALDLKSPDGLEILRKLVADADVVVDNFRPGALEALGLDYERLKELNSQLIYCSISGFGARGPNAGKRANDLFMQAFAGTMSVTGEPEGSPCKAGISVADIGAGMFAAFGVLLALVERARSGRGQRVETSLLEGQIAMLSYHLTKYFATGEPPRRIGAAMELSPAYRTFRTADDWIVVAAFTDDMWAGVCRAVGKHEWLDDSRFRTRRARTEHLPMLVSTLTEVFASKSTAEWLKRLEAENVPATRVNTIDLVVEHPQTIANEMVIDVEHPISGMLRMAGLPIKLSESPGTVRLSPPTLGQHTDQILHELGYGTDAIARLRDKRAIGSRTLSTV